MNPALQPNREHVSTKIVSLPNGNDLAVPHYEDMVCSCVLRDDMTYPQLSDILLPHDFTQELNIYLWKCFEDLTQSGTPIDRATALTQMEKFPQLTMKYDADTLKKWLLSILPTAPDVKNAVTYAKVVRERAQRIRAVESALHIATIMRDTKLETAKAWDMATSEWNKANETTSLAPTDMDNVGLLFQEELLSSEGTLIKTGFSPIDELGTTKRKRITMLAGSSGQGKSQFTLSLVHAVCTLPESERSTVAYFSFEMPKSELMQNFTSFETRITRKRLDEKKLTPDDMQDAVSAIIRIRTWDMHLFDTTDLEPTIDAIWRKVRNLKAKQDIGLVIVDGLWHLQHEGNQSDASRYQFNAMMLKKMATALNCHVWVCHQYNSGGLHLKEDDEPMIYHVDGGSMAVRDFDNVFMLKRHNNPSHPTEIYIRKSRGRSGIVNAHQYHYDSTTEKYTPFDEARNFGEDMANVPF